MTGALPFLPLSDEAENVLCFWFVQLGPSDWFSSSNSLDSYIEEKFADLLNRAAAGQLGSWLNTPKGMLALIIVLDQFSRNIHRGTARAFQHDAKAQSVTMQAIDSGYDEQLNLVERQFLYVPLMHAENRSLQRISVEKFDAIAKDGEGTVDYARQHRDIVERYGRFPYRNEMLGRQSTPEEADFIAKEGNPFS